MKDFCMEYPGVTVLIAIVGVFTFEEISKLAVKIWIARGVSAGKLCLKKISRKGNENE